MVVALEQQPPCFCTNTIEVRFRADTHTSAVERAFQRAVRSFIPRNRCPCFIVKAVSDLCRCFRLDSVWHGPILSWWSTLVRWPWFKYLRRLIRSVTISYQPVSAYCPGTVVYPPIQQYVMKLVVTDRIRNDV